MCLLLDFDLCNACMASPKAWEAHAGSHAFFPIHTKEEFLHFCLVKEGRCRRQRTHNGITCDGCKQKNVVGVRHKCLQCDGKTVMFMFRKGMLILVSGRL